MNIYNKFIIEVIVDGKTKYWNGVKPFVDDVNKAFICPNIKSVDKNINMISGFYKLPYRIIPLTITF